MLNLILHRVAKKGKSILTNAIPEHKIIFKPKEIEHIKQVKGYKSDAEMAKALNITRAYLTMMKHNKASVSSTVITRLAFLLGNVNGKWWTHFVIVPRGFIDPNHPIWNNEKYEGRIPYDEYSLAAEFRRLDYGAEKGIKNFFYKR